MNPSESPAARRFLDLATRPLADNAELHLAARGDLARRIDTSPAATDQALEQAADRLQAAEGKRWGTRLMTALSVLAVCAVLAWIGTTAMRMILVPQVLGAIGGPFGYSLSEPSRYFTYPSITDVQTRLLLFGDETAADDAGKWRPLWESEPSNAVHFANYVGAWQNTHGDVPDELLEHAEAIDPDNGWYLAFAVGSRLDDKVLEKTKNLGTRVTAGKRSDFKVLDEAEYAAARDLFFRAVEKPGYNDHSRKLYHERLSLMPLSEDVLSNLRNLAYLAGQTSYVIPIRRLASLICHEANQCVLSNDEEAFRRTVNAWRWFVDGFNQSGATLIDGLVVKGILAEPLPNFRDAAAHFGMTEEAALFDALHVEYQADLLDWQERAIPDADLIHDKGSLLTGLSTPMIGRMVKSPPPISEADAKPGRLADHALAGRLFAATIALLLFLAAGAVVGMRYRHGSYGRLLSERMTRLLRPADRLAMGFFGLALPVAWFLVVTRLTPLSSREWNPVFAGGVPLLGQWGALAVLIFSTTACTAAWRIDRRLRFLGWMPKSAWAGLVATLCAALAIPVFGAIPLVSTDGGRPMLWLGLGLGGIVAAWWFAGFFSVTTGMPGDGAVRRVAISRVLTPLWLAGALVMAGGSAALSLEERHWVERDTLMRSSPEFVGLSRYESEVTEQLRKELGEIIARLPEM